VYSVRVSYEQLAAFLENHMRMSHVYQPVMIMTLLRKGGRCSATEIARSILGHDESQVEYYEDVTKNMVGRVLRSHGIVEKENNGYYLLGYEDLDDKQVEHLIELCEAKLDEYKTKRGKRIWQHRKCRSGTSPEHSGTRS
jgi:ATP adenylyltransferase